MLSRSEARGVSNKPGRNNAMPLPIDETRPHLKGFSEFYEREIRGWL